jgi:hypothetical protein
MPLDSFSVCLLPRKTHSQLFGEAGDLLIQVILCPAHSCVVRSLIWCSVREYLKSVQVKQEETIPGTQRTSLHLQHKKTCRLGVLPYKKLYGNLLIVTRGSVTRGCRAAVIDVYFACSGFLIHTFWEILQPSSAFRQVFVDECLGHPLSSILFGVSVYSQAWETLQAFCLPYFLW